MLRQTINKELYVIHQQNENACQLLIPPPYSQTPIHDDIGYALREPTLQINGRIYLLRDIDNPVQVLKSLFPEKLAYDIMYRCWQEITEHMPVHYGNQLYQRIHYTPCSQAHELLLTFIYGYQYPMALLFEHTLRADNIYNKKIHDILLHQTPIDTIWSHYLPPQIAHMESVQHICMQVMQKSKHETPVVSSELFEIMDNLDIMIWLQQASTKTVRLHMVRRENQPIKQQPLKQDIREWLQTQPNETQFTKQWYNFTEQYKELKAQHQ